MARKKFEKPGGYSTDKIAQGLGDSALMSHMGVPDRIALYATSQSKRRMDERIEYWVDNLPYIYRPDRGRQAERPDLYAKGLIFWGPTSTHKTTTAAALLLRVIRMGIKNTDPSGRNFTWHGWCMGAFVDWQDASELFRRGVSSEDAAFDSLVLVQRMKPTGPMDDRGDFLVIDDISRERKTEFNSNELHRILRHRENWGYPTILTTNHHPKEWQDVYGGPMAGMLSRSFIGVEFE